MFPRTTKRYLWIAVQENQRHVWRLQYAWAEALDCDAVGEERSHCVHVSLQCCGKSEDMSVVHAVADHISKVNGIPWTYGAVHFQEVAFVFYNTMGLGYPQNLNPNPLGGPQRGKYLEISRLMSRMWISFVNFGDPNKQLGGESSVVSRTAGRWRVWRRNR